MRTQKPNQCKDPFRPSSRGKGSSTPPAPRPPVLQRISCRRLCKEGVFSIASLQLGVADLPSSLPVQRNIWALSAGKSSISLTSEQMWPLEKQGSFFSSLSPIFHCFCMDPSTPEDMEPQQWGEGREEKPRLAASCLTPGVQGWG